MIVLEKQEKQKENSLFLDIRKNFMKSIMIYKFIYHQIIFKFKYIIIISDQ